MASSTERALGKLLSKHRTDTGRRRRAAVRALVLGAVLVVAGAVAFAAAPAYAAAVLLLLGLLSLLRGVLGARDHRRLGTELFAVRERGLVHRRGGYSQAVPWEKVASVTVVRGARPLLWLAGRDTVCRVRLTEGGTIRVSPYTPDAARLAELVAEHVAAPAETGAGAPRRARQATA
ncbi:hypothetical protein [Streptomyces hoynatensis]|uniref:PH domain-containing protein n=1 Tax=Streptomyces hoynatensis TaxID=1141874 RepID=A0A3A9ZCI0_9ACTN|nr:hypothetical protein [Streptomyces hoynatensis]RKN45885.1 hypothetical protein D7294_05470 [Streptomyces hoynatensis]